MGNEIDRSLLKLSQVATILGVHYNTVLNWRRRGILPARKIGGQWFVTQEALNSLMLEDRKSCGEGNGS